MDITACIHEYKKFAARVFSNTSRFREQKAFNRPPGKRHAYNDDRLEEACKEICREENHGKFREDCADSFPFKLRKDMCKTSVLPA